MDDFILLHSDMEYLKYCREKIREKVESINLRLSTKKTQIQPISQCIHFLGFSYRLTESGEIICKVLSEKVSHERRKLKKLVARAKEGLLIKREVDACYKSWKAYVSGHKTNKLNGSVTKQMKRNTHSLILKMDQYYKQLWR